MFEVSIDEYWFILKMTSCIRSLSLSLSLQSPINLPLLRNHLRFYTHLDSDSHSNLTGFIPLLGAVLVLIEYK